MKKTVTTRAELVEVGHANGSPALRFDLGQGSAFTLLVSADDARAFAAGLYRVHDVTITVETSEEQP